MESHHDDDETKGSVYFFVQNYTEAREASGSVRTAGPKDLTVTKICTTEGGHWMNKKSPEAALVWCSLGCRSRICIGAIKCWSTKKKSWLCKNNDQLPEPLSLN